MNKICVLIISNTNVKELRHTQTDGGFEMFKKTLTHCFVLTWGDLMGIRLIIDFQDCVGMDHISYRNVILCPH